MSIRPVAAELSACQPRLPSREAPAQVIEHLHYHCPLYCWLSSARYRDGEAVVFLYIEYRDATRASRYRQWRFASLEQAQHFVGQQASTVVLPQISGLRTREQPIMGPSPGPAATAA